MATIADVARLAEVSVATVSRVINDSSAVRSETALRVQAVIKQLNYTPNLAARNLRRNESRVVMTLAPNFTNPYYSQILSGICDTSRRLGYITLVYNTYETLTMKEKALTRLIEETRVDGTIILACSYDDVWLNKYKGKYPIVQCSEYVQDSLLPHISVDNVKASHEMVSYLVSLGHRRIGFVGSENMFHSTRQRLAGYRKALEEAGLPFRDIYVAKGSVDYSFQSGKAAAAELLSLEKRPSAVFCVSDILAQGVIAQAQESGLSVPGDLSVTGFDDGDYTTMFHPHLTTVGIPCYEMGQKAMVMLQQCMQKKEDVEPGVFLPHRFVVRESCMEYKR